MFIASDNELREFTCKLLDKNFSCEVIKMLQQEDEKYLQIRYVKLSMMEKMPKELISSKFNTEMPLIANQIQNQSFPRMFDAKNKKAYEYINDDLQNIRKIADTYSEFPKVEVEVVVKEKSQVQEQLKEMEEPKIEGQLRIEIPEGKYKKVEENTPTPVEDSLKKSGKASSQSRPHSQQASKHSYVSKAQPNRFPTQPSQSRVNPFITNNMNFTDSNANSKTLQGKYSHLSLSQNSRNITAMVQSSKFNAFSNSTSFPTSVMPGTILAPKDTSFSKNAQLDVNDVMRYTLGVKKESQSRQKMENPFNRPPKKRNQ